MKSLKNKLKFSIKFQFAEKNSITQPFVTNNHRRLFYLKGEFTENHHKAVWEYGLYREESLSDQVWHIEVSESVWYNIENTKWHINMKLLRKAES